MNEEHFERAWREVDEILEWNECEDGDNGKRLDGIEKNQWVFKKKAKKTKEMEKRLEDIENSQYFLYKRRLKRWREWKRGLMALRKDNVSWKTKAKA